MQREDTVGLDDSGLPAPRRPGVPLFCRATAAAPEPRVADLSALLGEIDSLRTTLQADLSLAAAALDAGADQLAGELVDGDLLAMHDFEVRALAHLQTMDQGTQAGLAAEQSVAAAAPAKRRRLLPAGPLLVAAAALVGFVVGVVPERAASEPKPVMSSAAQASDALSRLARQGAPSEELRAAAEQLNDEVIELIAASEGSPATAFEALMLLQRSTDLLVNQGNQGSLRNVLATARRLSEQLRRALPPAVQRSHPPALTGLVAPPAEQQQPPWRTEPADEPSSPRSQAASPAPAPSAEPSAEPSAAPAPTEPASAEPTPAAPSSPAPSADASNHDRPAVIAGELPEFG